MNEFRTPVRFKSARDVCGAVAMEYVGVLVVAGVLIATLMVVAPGIASALSGKAARVVCAVTGSAGAECEAKRRSASAGAGRKVIERARGGPGETGARGSVTVKTFSAGPVPVRSIDPDYPPACVEPRRPSRHASMHCV